MKKPEDEEGMDCGEQRVKRTKVGHRKKQKTDVLNRKEAKAVHG